MSRVEIYYFSGTGNSLFAAKELQKRIPGSKLIPIVSLLDQEVIKTGGKSVGLVFPVHLATVPYPVKEFLKKLDLSSARYVFAVLTRGGTWHRAFSDLDKLLKKKGSGLDAYYIINMHDNNPRWSEYEVPTRGKIARMKSEALEKLDLIKNTIINQKKYREPLTSVTHIPPVYIWFSPVLFLIGKLVGIEDGFYCDENCSGCGLCEKVCLSGKIKMVDDRPVWQEDVRCYSCRACLNYCPMQSVQIKSRQMHTNKNGRYPHPFATADEIAAQKKKPL